MKKNNRYKLLFLPSMKGSGGFFLLSAIEVILGIVSLYCASIVTSYTLDWVLLGRDPSIPEPLFQWLNNQRSYPSQGSGCAPVLPLTL